MPIFTMCCLKKSKSKIMKKKIEVVHAGSLSTRNTVLSVMIIGLLFFIFGFTTWINAILIPYFKIACELNIVQSLFVAFAFYIAYLVMAIPAAHLLERVGFKKGIMIGFWIMALGALIFVPAALDKNIWIIPSGSFLNRNRIWPFFNLLPIHISQLLVPKKEQHRE